MPPFTLTADTPNKDLRLGLSAFEDVVIHDLIPSIDESYRTIPDRDHRAMADSRWAALQTLSSRFITSTVRLHSPRSAGR